MASDASLIISADIHGIICIFDGKLFDVDQSVCIWYLEIFNTLSKYTWIEILNTLQYLEVFNALKYSILWRVQYSEYQYFCIDTNTLQMT